MRFARILLSALAALAPLAAAACPAPPAGVPFTVAAQAESGQPLPLRWSDPWPAARDCVGATWLILAMPERVRFAGEGFFALAPGERAPFGIGFGQERMRAVIPLHIAPEGTLDILPWLIGPFALDWALVHVPVAEGEGGAPQVHAGGGMTLDVRPGPPEVVVQDPFDTALPEEVILSNSGEFLLEVFDGHYRARDAGTGALLHAGEGVRPNFSPTGRFVHAFPEPLRHDPDPAELSFYADLSVVDLFAGAEVLRIATGGMAQRGDFITTLHWSPGDSYLLILNEGEGALEFWPALLDRPRFKGYYGCGACSAEVDGKAVIEAENAFVALGSMWGVDRVSLLVPWSAEGAITASHGLDSPHGLLVPPRLRRPGAFASAADEDAWRHPEFDLLGRPRTSHAGSWRFLEGMKGQAEPLDYAMVVHRRLAAGEPHAEPVDAAGIRSRGATAIGAAAAVRRSDRAFRRLADLGLVAEAAPAMARDPLPIVTEEADGWFPRDTDDPYYTIDPAAPGLARGLILPAEAEAMRALWPEIFAGVGLCIVGPANAAEAATLRHRGAAVVLFHYHCRTGTGSEPEGALLMLRAEGAAAHWQLLVASPDWDPAWGPAPEPHDEGAAEAFDDSRAVAVLPAGSVAAHAPLAVARLTEDLVVLAGLDGAGVVFDVSRVAPAGRLAGLTAPAQIEVIAPLRQGGIIQVNADGRFFVHDPASDAEVPGGQAAGAAAEGAGQGGGPLLSGLHVDDEIVVFDRALNFEATPEGARYVQVRFPGDRHLHALDQLGAAYRAEGVVAAALAGAPLPAPPTPALPPRLADIALEGGTLRASVQADGGLAHVALFRDGVEVARQALSGTAAEVAFALPALPETRGFALRATDAQGLVSRAAAIPWQPAGPARGRLFVLAVGTDRYDDPGIGRLGFAVADAEAFAGALSDGASGYYAAVTAEVIADSRDLAGDVPARLAALTEGMTAEDTLFLHIAGHGFTDASGALRLADRATRLGDLAGTALAFDALAAALAEVPGRVVVFLDACHSGAAGAGTNDDAVAALLAEGRPLAVLAASKGRQESFEAARLGGGAFTAAMVRALADPATDLDGNGTVELAELYAAVKRDVVLATDGEQTPWIARSGFVGEVPLF